MFRILSSFLFLICLSTTTKTTLATTTIQDNQLEQSSPAVGRQQSSPAVGRHGRHGRQQQTEYIPSLDIEDYLTTPTQTQTQTNS